MENKDTIHVSFVDESEISNVIFNNIDRLLDSKGENKAWLTKKLNSSFSYFTPTYRKKASILTLKKLLVLADALDCSITDLLIKEDENSIKVQKDVGINEAEDSQEEYKNNFCMLSVRQCQNVLLHATSYLE